METDESIAFLIQEKFQRENLNGFIHGVKGALSIRYGETADGVKATWKPDPKMHKTPASQNMN